MVLLFGLLLLSGGIALTKQVDHQATAYAESVSKAMSHPSPSPTKTITSTRPSTNVAQTNSTTRSSPLNSSVLKTTAGLISPIGRAAPAISNNSSMYANPNSNLANGAASYSAANPGSIPIMNRLAATPMAQWFGDFSGNIQSAANNYVSAAVSQNKVPVLVTYNIPERDCGSYSSGGAASPTAYEGWISSLADGIGQRQAIVIVEPDALAGMDCLSNGDQQSRLQLLNFAVQSLRSKTNAAIYLDAGNPNWQSTATMASRLSKAGISEASGFSLNVSNFVTTASNISYGSSLSKLVGSKHFVIDTSRNGNGPTSGSNAWCNPDGRAFGNTPTLSTGNSQVDAFLWIKNPGESDGSCGPVQQNTIAPPAGQWWPQYALMLARNSNW